jgi:hypothetical protein
MNRLLRGPGLSWLPEIGPSWRATASIRPRLGAVLAGRVQSALGSVELSLAASNAASVRSCVQVLRVPARMAVTVR